MTDQPPAPVNGGDNVRKARLFLSRLDAIRSRGTISHEGIGPLLDEASAVIASLLHPTITGERTP